jgi:hypothetical protein
MQPRILRLRARLKWDEKGRLRLGYRLLLRYLDAATGRGGFAHGV